MICVYFVTLVMILLIALAFLLIIQALFSLGGVCMSYDKYTGVCPSKCILSYAFRRPSKVTKVGRCCLGGDTLKP